MELAGTDFICPSLGTYENPLDKQRKQFSSLWEVTYAPERFKGWSASVALGMDRGNYLGNSTGG